MAKSVKGLSAKQHMVIDLLLTGKNDTEAAKTAGCNRFSISRWRSSDPLFISEYNKRLNDMNQRAVAPYHKRLDELIDISIATLSQSIKAGDCVASRWLLDKVNIFPSAVSAKFADFVELPEPLPTDIEDIIDDLAEKAIIEVWKEDGKSEFEITLDSETFNKLKREIANSIRDEYQNQKGEVE